MGAGLGDPPEQDEALALRGEHGDLGLVRQDPSTQLAHPDERGPDVGRGRGRGHPGGGRGGGHGLRHGGQPSHRCIHLGAGLDRGR